MTITRHTIAASMVLPTFYAPVSLAPKYADGFDSGVGGWQVGTLGTTFTQVFNPATPSYEMQSAWVWDGVSIKAGSVGHVGMTTVPGKTYQLTANARVAAGTTAQARVSFGNSGGGTIVSGGGWVVLSTTPVPVSILLTAGATGTAMNPILEHGTVGLVGTTATVFWEDVTVYEMAATTVLDLRPERASVTLDESWSPYARATITGPLPPTDALPKIDPRVMNRVQLSLQQVDTESRPLSAISTLFAGQTLAALTTAYAGKTLAWLSDQFGDLYNAAADPALNQGRTMDLQLRTRTLDYVAGTMTLELTSDEMLLQDFARPESTTSQFTPPNTTSLITLVNWGLSHIGAGILDLSSTDALINPATFIWNVGETIWTFLDAFVRSANLRLWCDDQRRWYLTPPQTGTAGVATLVSVVTLNDTLSRDDDGYGDATVIVYEWVDAAGLTQRQVGNYYLPTMQQPKMFVQRFNNPQPVGTSPASALRDRTVSRGRTVNLRAVSDYRVRPGQAAAISTPVTSVTGAMVSGVTWQWPDDEMEVRTRDATA